MKLPVAIKKFNIENFDYKNHEFIFQECFCVVCYKDLSKNKYGLFDDDLKQFIIDNPDYCSDHNHTYIKQYECKKCNMYIEIGDYKGENDHSIFYVEESDVLKGNVYDVFKDSEKYLSCEEFIIKNIVE